MTLAADTDMLEYVCNENPQSRPHLVGRTDQERKVIVPTDILQPYVVPMVVMSTIRISRGAVDSPRSTAECEG
jgi:hypothetical protein